MGAAAKTVIETLVVVDGKGRRLFIVEGAQARMFPAPLCQLHPPGNQIHQPDAAAQFIYKMLRYRHAIAFIGLPLSGSLYRAVSIGPIGPAGIQPSRPADL
jgi:hypothetical protein